MRSFYLLVTGASLLSFLSLQAEPTEAFEIPSSTLNLLSEDDGALSSSSIDEELSLLDEEMEAFEDEILALEEELKRDAEALGESDQKALVAIEMPENNLAETVAAEPIAEVEAAQEMDLVQAEPPAAALQAEEIAVSPAEPAIAPLPETASSVIAEATQMEESPATLNIEMKEVEKKNEPVEVDIQQAFAGSPIIYTVLLGMSIFAFCVWLYSLLSLRKTAKVSSTFIQEIKNKLNSNSFDDAFSLCSQQENLIGKMVATGINARRHGLPVMIENMKIEGKRASVQFWQRIGLLNDIAIIAPMIGLLGTVLGMFYAFYDINRSIESISTLFDGLGVSVGTTVAGLIVAILALMLHSFAKYHLVKVLTIVENEAQTLATLIDDRTAEYQKR